MISSMQEMEEEIQRTPTTSKQGDNTDEFDKGFPDRKDRV
jgi:hypothetical protein